MSTSAGKRLWKQYAALTRVERVNLILAAQEEGDQDEVLALENTCSEEERRLLNAHLLCLSCAASAVAIQLLALNVLTVKRIEDLLHGAQAAAGDQPGKDPCASPNPALAGLSDADARWACVADDDKLAALDKEAAAAWLGFSRWCWEVGHDPHQVLRQAPMGSTEIDLPYTILCDQIKYSERWAGDLVSDPEHASAFYHLLSRGFWSIGY
jgi:hypothetical protein